MKGVKPRPQSMVGALLNFADCSAGVGPVFQNYFILCFAGLVFRLVKKVKGSHNSFCDLSVADLGEGPRGPGTPFL